MKRFFALLLAVAVLATLAACKADTYIRGDITSTPDTSSSKSEDTAENGFTFGVTAGGKYENSFIGIGCELDSDWTYYDEQQIRELNSAAIDMVDEDYAKKIENADIIYDMYASHADGRSSINVNLEKLGKLEVSSLDLENNLETILPNITEQLENMGYSDVKYELATVKIDNEEFVGADITATLEEYTFREKLFCIKCDAYVANITVAAFDNSIIDTVLEKFYILD